MMEGSLMLMIPDKGRRVSCMLHTYTLLMAVDHCYTCAVINIPCDYFSVMSRVVEMIDYINVQHVCHLFNI